MSGDMTRAPQSQELTERFIQFYQNYCRDQIGELSQRYPHEQRSLYVDYDNLYAFDPDLAEDYLAKPDQLQRYAEEALRLYDLPTDISLGQAHVRLTNLPASPIEPGTIRVHDDHIGRLVTVHGYVEDASDIEPKITEAAFECQRCGTWTYIPQQDTGFQEPHECQGCEKQGPFRVKYDQSEFVDRQTATLIPLPEAGLAADGELEVVLEDDIAGEVAKGDRAEIVGILHIDQEGSKTTFSPYLTGTSVSRISSRDTGLHGEPYLEVPDGEIGGEALESFIKRSVAVLRTQTLDETETQNKVITPFLHLLGWNIYHPEVRFEYSDPEVDGARVDYALLDDSDNPIFVVEAKQEGTNLDTYFGQIKKYIRLFQVNYGLLTNGERYVFFCTDPGEGSPSELKVLDCTVKNLPRHEDVLAAYTRESLVGERSSLEELAEAVRDSEEEESAPDGEVFKSRYERLKNNGEIGKAAKQLISQIENKSEEGASMEEVRQQLGLELGLSEDGKDEVLKKLRRKGELYEPVSGYLRTT